MNKSALNGKTQGQDVKLSNNIVLMMRYLLHCIPWIRREPILTAMIAGSIGPVVFLAVELVHGSASSKTSMVIAVIVSGLNGIALAVRKIMQRRSFRKNFSNAAAVSGIGSSRKRPGDEGQKSVVRAKVVAKKRERQKAEKIPHKREED